MTEYLTTLACIAGAIGIAALIGALACDAIRVAERFGLKLRDLRNLHSGSDTK